MKYLKIMLFAGALGLMFSSCKESAVKEEPFKYLADEFADIKVIRYRIPGWDSLSFQQKEYIYHLSEAAKSGRDIFWDQNFRHGLRVRKVLENIFENYKGEQESEDWKNFVIYAKRVFFSNGIHHHYAEEKFIPACSQEYFSKLLTESGQEGESAEILPLLYDPAVYPHRKNITGEGDLLLGSAVNFYDGVSKAEAEAFYAKMIDAKDTTPVSYGLNSKLVKRDGKIFEEVYKVGGLYGPAIEKIISHLEAASAVAENDTQRGYIAKLIEYYKSGDLNMWDEYNIAWVKDTESQVDFINGFIEDYNDPMGMKASWESVVNYKDLAATKRADAISGSAQWFEDNSPVDPRFKKKEVKGVSAKVITAAMLGGDCYPSTPIGINLPNANWIRKNHGSKSVTIENITYAYDQSSLKSPFGQEFTFSAELLERAKTYGPHAGNIHTDLHEVLGHGSGQLLPGVADEALKNYSSPIEESRADLFALYYIMDDKMLELGLLPHADAAKAEYDLQIRNGLMTQLTRIQPGKTVEQAHMRGRAMVSHWVYEKGKPENVISRVTKDGKTYFVVNDYPKLRRLYGQLLAEVQRITSEGDYEAAKALIETYGVQVDQELHKEVLERYAKLNLAPYAGFVNPVLTPVVADGRIVDVKIDLTEGYVEQMLRYGRDYAFLK
ncbi:MAG TPA: dihydrofolate reductase [Candidatus Aminicenantes bacterium]|nr:dihydrofolate reductase [Candidatus Aminicenantes bacterium]